MALKRTYQVQSKYAPNAKRPRLNIPGLLRLVETKEFTNVYGAGLANGTVGYADLCNIAQGSAANQRIGNKVQILKVEIRGCTNLTAAPAWASIYIVAPKDNAVPTASWCAGVPGGHINPLFGNELALKVYHTSQTPSPRIIWKPKYPWIVQYSDAAGNAGFRNRCFLMVSNFGAPAATLTPALSYKVWYRDL